MKKQMMEVTINGRTQRREVKSVEEAKIGPPLMYPYLKPGEEVFHMSNGEVLVINVRAAARTSRYENAKPWSKLP